MCNVTITPKVVFDELSSIKPSASPGPTGYSNRFLYDYRYELCVPLALIFKNSLMNNIVPPDWKMADVIPIFKKGSKGSPSNYRPVSLTCVVGKVLERIIKKSIVVHLENNNLILPTQHGFMANKSCATNLLTMLEELTSAFDKGESYDIIFYDFAKAFDKVPKERLLHKVEALGIKGNILEWIRSWLTNRKQRTKVNNAYSRFTSVLSGVPQGSVLGPLLFIIFINDIDFAARLIKLLLKFADDTKTANKIMAPKDCEDLQSCINDMCKWAETWAMEINVTKCKVLHIGRNNPRHIYTMNNVPLETVTSEKDIGVLIGESLKPSLQCAQAAHTARGVLCQILRSFHYRDKYIFKQLYTQYVRPHLEFSCLAWSP